MAISLKVAVVGAGLSGLRAAYELQKEGHRVIVFEKSEQLGGTWVYDSEVETDELGLDPRRRTVHSSLYQSLRINLPRKIMGFSDYSFGNREYGDSRAFPGHEEVLKYLEDFARHFKLSELIRYDSEVVRVERVDSKNDEWVVESRASGLSSEEVFEAVVVCNGHFSDPRLADDIPGIERWSKRQTHSHNYRIPEPFRNQIVVMIGIGASAYDICREIATIAKEVHISSRSPDAKVSKLGKYNNIWQHSKIECVHEDGRVFFQDGFSTEADVIIHCTGYKTSFPFLKTDGIVSVDDNRVGPLYKHVFTPQLAHRLSFIGLPQKTLVPRMIELQSKWIAQALSGKVVLPLEEEMLADVEAHYQQITEKGIPKHYSHCLNFQDEYLDWIAAQVGTPIEKWVKEMFLQTLQQLMIPDLQNFRDVLNFDNFVCED